MSKTILLADDSLTIQKVVELTFSDTDFEVIATSSGNELLERLPSSGADIVICDTIMPGTDGYAVCQAIKSESSSLHIPVILMTGTFEPFDRDRALAAGCSEIITKPFEARHLVETVERLVSDEGVAAPAPEPFAGSVAPPDFGGGVTPPAPDQGVSEFGTMLSPPQDFAPEGVPEESEDGLDFTSTGFAEMEAAATEGEFASDAVPDHGLDFEPPVVEESAADALDAVGVVEAIPAEPAQPVPADDIGDETDPFGAASAEIFAHSDEPEGAPETEEPEVFEPEPMEASPVEPEVGDSYEAEVQPGAEYPIDTDPVVEVEPEIEDLPEPVDVPEPEDLPEVMSEPEVVPEPEIFVEPEIVPEPEVVPAPVVVPEVIPEPEDRIEAVDDTPSIGGLSDEDIDRIARRVVELAGDRLEKIAWDVIPDMAEIVVRERLRELEDDIENQAGTNEPN